jgi:hypothetical protein
MNYDLLRVQRQSATLSNEQLVVEFSSLYIKPSEKNLDESSQAKIDDVREKKGTSDGIVLKSEIEKYQRRRSYD